MTFNRTVQQLSELIEVRKHRRGQYKVERFSDGARFYVTNRGSFGLRTDGWFIRDPETRNALRWCFTASAALRTIANEFDKNEN